MEPELFLGGCRAIINLGFVLVGCSEWGCFDDQRYCPIPLPVGMQNGAQAGLQGMSILCGHKSVGSPWEQAGEGDAGARRVLEETAQELPAPPTVPAQLCWLQRD